MNPHSESIAGNPEHLVDERTAYRLAEEHNLPPIEVDAALYGELLATARGVLNWCSQRIKSFTGSAEFAVI